MKFSLVHRTTAFALLVVFFFFSVGIPVVQSLCPMMEGTNEPCPMHEQGCTNEVAIDHQFGDCCATKIVAERSTTPAIKFEEKKSTASHTIVGWITSEIQPASRATFSTPRDVPSTDSSPPPLFLLHSTLLI
jgi:hypothetical protein